MKRFYFSKELKTSSANEENDNLRAIRFDTSNWGEVYVPKKLFEDNSNFDFLFGKSNSLEQIEEASRLDILNLDFCRIVLTEDNTVVYTYDAVLEENKVDVCSGLANSHLILKTTDSDCLMGSYLSSGKFPVKLNDSSLLENEHPFSLNELFQVIAKYPGDYTDEVSLVLQYGEMTDFNIGGNTYKKVIAEIDDGFDFSTAEFTTGYYNLFPNILYAIPTSVEGIYEVAMKTERELTSTTYLTDENSNIMSIKEVITRDFDHTDDSNTFFNSLFSEELDSTKLHLAVFYKDQLVETFQVDLNDFVEGNELNINSNYIRLYMNREIEVPSQFRLYRTYLNYGLNGDELENDYLPTLNDNIISSFSKYYLFASITEVLTDPQVDIVIDKITSDSALKKQTFFCVPESYLTYSDNPYLIPIKDMIIISDKTEFACLLDSLLYTYFLNNYIFNIENLRVNNGTLSHIFRTSSNELQWNSKGSNLLANLNPVTDLGYRFLKFKLKKDLYLLLVPMTFYTENEIRVNVETLLENYKAYGNVSIVNISKINKNIRIELRLDIYKGIETIEVYS